MRLKAYAYMVLIIAGDRAYRLPDDLCFHRSSFVD